MNQLPIRIAEKSIFKKSLKLFFLFFVSFGCIIGGMVSIYYQAQLDTAIAKIENSQSIAVSHIRIDISDEFDKIVSDLLFLANQNELEEYFNTGDPEYRKKIANEFLEFAVHKRIYDQIRFLDSNGMEIVRINYNKKDCCVVPESELQDKANRYYFIEALKLEASEVFVSPMDLNIENCQIEKPLKPMVRFASPVFDAAGTKRGLIVINYLAQHILDSMKNALTSSLGSPMLVNKDGYWLLGNAPADAWGFVIPERKDRKFSNTYPNEWREMAAHDSGQLYTEQGLFTFVKIFPLQQAFTSGSGSTREYIPSVRGVDPHEYYWILLAHVPQDVMQRTFSQLQVRLFLLGAGLFFVISLAAWLLALAITRRRIYQSHLISMALYDSLTGLPNRKLFFDRLEGGLNLAERYGRRLGILYIDLDGFKNVNDTLGHEAGDELLIKVSKLFESITRKADTVARLGGDEFAVILTEINSLEDGEIAGNKIIAALSHPVRLKAGKVTIGASIGVAVYPDVTSDLEALVRAADKAMYRSKEKGKDNCTLASS